MEQNNISQVDMGLQNPSDLMTAFEVDSVPEANLGSTQEETGLVQETGQETGQEIDERFQHLSKEEAIYRTLQSKYDKLYTNHTNAVREQEQNSKYIEFLNDLMDDDEVLEAFLYERKPELVKTKDITSIIQQKLNTEFGDYKPTRDEADEEPGGKAWLYFKRLDELYNETKNKSGSQKTVKELRQQRELSKKQKEAEIKNSIDTVKTVMKWDDTQIKAYYDWMQKLDAVNLAKIYNFAVRTMRIPSVTGIAGSAQTPSVRKNFLDSI